MNDAASIQIVPVERPKRFVDALDAYLQLVVVKYLGQHLNKVALENMRDEIHEGIAKLIRRASFPTHENLIRIITTEYFLNVSVNGMLLRHIPGVIDAFKARVDTAAIPRSELELYAGIFRETDIGQHLNELLSGNVR